MDIQSIVLLIMEFIIYRNESLESPLWGNPFDRQVFNLSGPDNYEEIVSINCIKEVISVLGMYVHGKVGQKLEDTPVSLLFLCLAFVFNNYRYENLQLLSFERST